MSIDVAEFFERNYKMNRREFVKKSSTSVLAATILNSNLSPLFADTKASISDKPVNLAVIGVGGRGFGLMKALVRFPNVNINAVCDIVEEKTNRAIEHVKRKKGNAPIGYSRGPYDYRRMLERDDFDGVLIATPTQLHVEMSTDAMNAGKHVGTEVPSGYYIDELWKLVEAKEKSGKHYMLLENYNYMRNNMMFSNMADKGVLGELYYGVCSYIHATPKLNFNPDGTLTWRGKLRRDAYGNWYPTHAIGPVSKWMDINNGDKLDYLVCMQNKPKMAQIHAMRQFGPDSKQAKIDFKTGEAIICLIYTAKGKLIQLDFGPISPRPAQVYYGIQGTKGAADTRYGVYIENKSPHKWENIDKYREEYDHNYWKAKKKNATKAGHGGGDYFVMYDFIEMIRQDKEPWINVYDGAVWSAIYECSKKSLDNRSCSVDIPDFTRGKWRLR